MAWKLGFHSQLSLDLLCDSGQILFHFWPSVSQSEEIELKDPTDLSHLC